MISRMFWLFSSVSLSILYNSLASYPNEILNRKALSMPHRTIIDAEQAQIDVLNNALKRTIVKEIQSSTITV